MGEAAEKLSGKLGLDTTDFKTGVAGANRELRVLESGFRAGVAALGDWSQSASGLETRIQSLTKQIDIQKLKVAATREEYERIKAEKGENSRAAQDLEIKLNKETETLGKMENELGTTEQSLNEMQSGTDEAGESAQEAGKKFEGFGTILKGVQGMIKGTLTVVLGLVAGVAAVGAAITGLTFTSAAAADEIATLSVQTGISTDRLQEMDYAGAQLGVTLDTMTGANARLIRSMNDATQQTADFAERQDDAQEAVQKAQSAYNQAVQTYGASSKQAQSALEDLQEAEERLAELTSGEMAQAFETLGVSVTDAQGNLRDSQAVFQDVLTALAGISNPAERDALAMQIFGKSAQELNPLIAAGADELARLSDEAHRNGAVVSNETITTLADLQDQLDGLKGGLKGVGLTLAGAFAPFFSGVLGQAQGYLQQLVGIVTGSGGDFGKMAEGLAGLFTQIAQDIATQAPAMLQAGLAIIQSLLTAILGALPELLTAATEILNTLVGFIVQALPQLIQAAVPILLTLVNAIVANLPLIVDAALKAIIALADGLSAAAPELIPAIVEVIALIVVTLLQNLPALAQAGGQLIWALAQGLASVMKTALFPQGTQAVEGLIANFILGAVKFVQAGIEAVRYIGQGIQDGLAALDAFGKNMYDKINASITRIKNSLLGIGKNIVEGVWSGIEAAADWFYGMITDFFSGMVASVLGALGIQSPSKVFAEIGKYTVQGFAQGFQREFRNMEGQLAASFGGLSFGLNPLAVGAGLPGAASAAPAGNVTNIYLNGIQLQNAGPDTTIGELMSFLNIRAG